MTPPSAHGPLGELQRSAGNVAVTTRLASGAVPITIQRQGDEMDPRPQIPRLVRALKVAPGTALAFDDTDPSLPPVPVHPGEIVPHPVIMPEEAWPIGMMLPVTLLREPPAWLAMRLAKGRTHPGEISKEKGGAPPEPVPVEIPPGSRMLRRGSRGSDVEDVQSELNDFFFTHGAKLEVDGIFGPLTDGAVRRFQSEKGLGDDGIVGPKTWAALGLTEKRRVPSVYSTPSGGYGL